MTILCPAEFHAAVQFAVKADIALAYAIEHESDKKRKAELEERRGQGVRTLLQCFGYRANSDAISSAEPLITSGEKTENSLGEMHAVVKGDRDSIPLQETRIWSDIAEYSFFFRECYIDPVTRQQVNVYDEAWYIFSDKTTQEEADNLCEKELHDRLFGDGVRRTFDWSVASQAKSSKMVVRDVMQQRIGMCGGIIYHPDYNPDGTKCQWGSWSTHT